MSSSDNTTGLDSTIIFTHTIHAAAVRLPLFASNEPLTWFRRAETQFRLTGIRNTYTQSDYVHEVIPDSVFRRLAPWLHEQPDRISYGDLKQRLPEEYIRLAIGKSAPHPGHAGPAARRKNRVSGTE